MAELSEDGGVKSGKGKKRGGVRAKKMSTRIDMTPMVDLGFLLVTFFILTTTMSKPRAMAINVPDLDTTNVDRPKIRNSEVTTYLLGPNDKIYYYNGDSTQIINTTNYTKLRTIVINRDKEVRQLQLQNGWVDKKTSKPNGLYVLIKPTKKSDYGNLVNFLDEMKIVGINPSIMAPSSDDLKNLKL